MYDLVTIGDAVSDLFIKPHEISVMCPVGKRKDRTCFEPVLCFGYGDKIPIEDIYYDIGGGACNVAVGLARQGFKVGFVGIIGGDAKGKEILTKLEKEEVSTHFIKKMKEIKTNFSIILSIKGERTILVYRGLSDYSKITLPKNLGTKWLFTGPLGEGFEKLYTQIISQVSTKNMKLAFNPGTIQIEKGKEALIPMLRLTKVLFLNKEEAEKVCDAKKPSQPRELLFELKKMGPEIVIITDGSEGAYYCEENECFKISAYRSDKKETTGAGDAFSSGVLAALLSGEEMNEAIRWGIVNSAAVIEKVGAQNGLLNATQIKSRLKTAPYPKKI